MKILTISIAAYNVSRYLRKALDSLIVVEEYLSKLDVIIVNDGSTDETGSIAEEYVSRYPRSFRIISKENGGYGSTINVSLQAASGKYYKLLDGDDWYDKDALCGLIDFLENADADLVVSPYYMVKREESVVPHHPEIPETVTAIHSLELADDKLFQMHGIAVRTDRLRGFSHPIAKHCFYTDIEYLFYCFAVSDTITRYNNPVYYYRLDVNGQSVSLAGIQKHYRDHLKVTERICKCYEKECQGFRGTKKEIIDYAVTFSIYGVFNNYMVLPDAGKRKQELKSFDAHIHEEYPMAYERGYDSSVIRMVRRVNFKFYGLSCAYMKFKFGRF